MIRSLSRLHKNDKAQKTAHYTTRLEKVKDQEGKGERKRANLV